MDARSERRQLGRRQTAAPGDMRLFSGNAHPRLAAEISEHLGIAPGRVDVLQFANENVFARFGEDICGQDVFLVQPFASPVSVRIMELLVMADAARRESPRRVTAVIPFYAYGRTDVRREAGEPLTAKLLADLITVAGIDRVLTLDLHASQIQGFFDIPLDEMTAVPLFADRFRERIDEPVIVAPHEGSTRWAKGLANELGLPLAILAKRAGRTNDDAPDLRLLGDVRGKAAILIENEIDTGRSLATAARRLVEEGATRVSAAATHAVLSEGAVERLRAAPIDDLLVTDSLPLSRDAAAMLSATPISVAALLGEAIRRIHERGAGWTRSDER